MAHTKMMNDDNCEACKTDGCPILAAGFDDKSAYAQCIFAYTPDADTEPVIFDGRTPGRIVPAQGDNNFGWDPIFMPDGFSETYAELDKDIKNTISHRCGPVPTPTVHSSKSRGLPAAWLPEERLLRVAGSGRLTSCAATSCSSTGSRHGACEPRAAAMSDGDGT